jgi:hypothetical protein
MQNELSAKDVVSIFREYENLAMNHNKRGSVVKPPKLRLKYDLAVRWVSRLTLPSILGGCDNMPGVIRC